MKTIKCIVTESSGKFETDTIMVVSPTGSWKRVWTHKDEIRNLSVPSRMAWADLRNKISSALRERRNWTWETKPKDIRTQTSEFMWKVETHATDRPEWKPWVAEKNERYPSGINTAYADLTIEEMKLMVTLED